MSIEHSFFYNGDTTYGEEELGAVFDATIRSGVAVDDDGNMGYEVGNSGNTITVKAGKANVGSRWRFDDQPTNFTISAPSDYTRIDRVVIRTDYVNKITSIVLKPGTPASSPIPPALQRDATAYEISLARVTITPANSIQIADERHTTSVCGGIRTRDCSEFDGYLKEIQGSFANWFEQQQGKGWREIAISDTLPVNPTAGTIYLAKNSTNKILTLFIANETSTFEQYDGIATMADGIYCHDGNGANEKPLSKMAFTKIIGVGVSGDYVKSGSMNVVPFDKAQDGFVSESSYAHTDSSRVVVDKPGLYHVSGVTYISDGANQGDYSWHCSCQKNGIMATENYGKTDGKACGVSFSGVIRCEAGDKLSMFVGTSGSNLWRLSAQYTNMQVYPLVLD